MTPQHKNRQSKSVCGWFQNLQGCNGLNHYPRPVTPTAQYKPGDQVWLEVTHLKLPHQGSKLNLKWYGPFKVLREISLVAYQLELPISWMIHPVFHISLLTPYVKTHAHRLNYSCPPPDLINDEEQYEVEQIRNHQHHGWSRTLQYLIKWWGYPKSDHTWEPADQVYALDLLQEYHKPALGKHKKEAESPGKNNNLHYHIIQITHHSFIMAFSPAPLPVQLPGHLKSESVIVTDQLVNSTLCSDPVPSNQITIPGPLHNLKTNAFWDGPLSPFTIQNILAGHKNLTPAQLWALVAGLATTL